MTKKKRRRKRRLRLSKQGALILAMFGLAAALIIGVCLLRNVPADGAQSPDDSDTAAAVGTPAAEATPEATPSPSPTAAPSRAPSGSRLPTDEEAAHAVEGIIRTSNVVLHTGPNKDYGVVKKYDVGEYLLVYAHEADYSLVQIMGDGNYGFLCTEFVTQFGVLPSEVSATPVPTVAPGAVMGIVNVEELRIRSVPSQDGNDPVGLCKRGDLLWVTLHSGEFTMLKSLKRMKRVMSLPNM